jgi:hypothetical protein
MKQHSRVQHAKWLLIVLVLVCSFFVPMSAQTAKAEGEARAGYANGFNEQFTRGASNWLIGAGRWTYGGGFVNGYGMYDDFGELWFRQSAYRNFDYEVRMKRVGCRECGNSIKFRDTGQNSGYFGYTNTGYFYIAAGFGSVWQDWMDWTFTTAIRRGDFNVLRVVASGNNYSFYINKRLVAYGNMSGLSSGVVGIEHYSEFPGGNILMIDYAVLKRR